MFVVEMFISGHVYLHTLCHVVTYELFSFSPSSIRPRVHLNIIHLWYSRCLRVKLRQSEDILLREAESMGIVIWCQERDWSRASESSVSLN